jgi:sigma-B regulation protein RsbU (phosphoserine phosphatase)
MNMRVLIAEDDMISRRVLQATLERWGYEVTVTCDGQSALQALSSENSPRLAILDWMMPKLDGIEVCRCIRGMPGSSPRYLILLTAKGSKQDIVTGLDGGADDYLTKPFDRDELHARLRVGMRMVELQNSLADRVHELEDALKRVKQLQSLIPVCAYCKKIRDDQNYWQQVDEYLSAHTDARISHSICPHCMENVLMPELENMRLGCADAALAAGQR